MGREARIEKKRTCQHCKQTLVVDAKALIAHHVACAPKSKWK